MPGRLLISSHAPDLLLLDRDLGKGDSYAAARLAQRLNPRCRSALLSSHFSAGDYIRARRNAVAVLLAKSTPPSALAQVVLDLVRAAARDSRGCDVAAAFPKLEGELPSLLRLTPRELEILGWLASGRTVPQTAWAMGLSPKTVDVHKTKLMAKLQIHDRATLTRYAVLKGVVPPLGAAHIPEVPLQPGNSV